MRKITLYAFLTFFVIVALENCRSTRLSTASEGKYSAETVLAMYGEHIYERESCSSCHTQQIANETLQLTSLDGLGGKYQDNWLYMYLHEPDALIIPSFKAPYAHLHTTPLERQTLKTLASEHGLLSRDVDIESLWNELLRQADGISGDIEFSSMGLSPSSRVEVYALIDYLQRIPTTARKIELDSIKRQELFKELEVWDAVTWDDNSILLDIAQNPDNAAKGGRWFQQYCAVCHGEAGRGDIGPNLTDEYWLHGGQPLDIARTITYGIPAKGMQSWKLLFRPQEVGELVAYILSIQGTEPPNAKEPQGVKEGG